MEEIKNEWESEEQKRIPAPEYILNGWKILAGKGESDRMVKTLL